jgi:8-oxo-dGTP pyrophosphatase MutT (NUDIX family)
MRLAVVCYGCFDPIPGAAKLASFAKSENKEQEMAESGRVPARPASVVVLARPSGNQFEVFMVRRHIRSEFVPDAYVFPGGSVKEADVATEMTPNLCTPVTGSDPTSLGSGFRAAAIRECFEEAGVLLAAGSSPLDKESLAAYRDDLNQRRLSLIQIAEREGLSLATDELLHWAHWITPVPISRNRSGS